MPRPWFTLKPCGADFLSSAPQRQVGVFEISQPVARVWDALTADDTLSWCRALSEVSWTSPRPFGEGTTRTVRTPLGLLLLNEAYFRWEEGRRKSFYVTQASSPCSGDSPRTTCSRRHHASSCRFTWTVASEAPPAARPGAPLNAVITRSLFADTRRHFNADSQEDANGCASAPVPRNDAGPGSPDYAFLQAASA